MMHLESGTIYLSCASICAIVAAGFDIKSRRIPNFITGPAILAGLILHMGLDGWRGLLTSLTAALLCGIVFLVFHIAGGMGAGDVKLITAVAAIAGLSNAAYLLVFTSIAGGVMAIGLILLRGRIRETLLNVGELTAHHLKRGLTPHPELNVRTAGSLRLPYGLAIAAGVALTFYVSRMQG
jgi:prepilin peptidase CpaA